jgi:hypothetical protein
MPKKKTTKQASVRLVLSKEQLQALSGRAKAAAAGKLTVSIVSEDKVVGKLKIAAYSYHGDTCCV